jgi:serine protease
MNKNKIIAFLMASIIAISIVAMATPALGGGGNMAKEKPEIVIDEPPGPESEPKKPEELDDIEPEVREPDPYFNPVFRDAVIVYFNEMPTSLGEFASEYGVTVIFVKEEIKMAAFETEPSSMPMETSQRTLDFVEEVSKDPCVEKAYEDGSMFVDPKKRYEPEPEIVYPEDFVKQGVEYVPNKVIVGFWRLPPSLEEFASKYDAKHKNFGEAYEVLLFAVFETDDVTEFIKRVSTDPYVRYAHPDPIGHICYTPDDPKWNQQWGPKEIDQDPYVRHAEPNSVVYVTYTPNDPMWNQQWRPKEIDQRRYLEQVDGNTKKPARVSMTTAKALPVVHKKIPAVKVMNISVRRGGALYKYPQKIGGNMKK